MPNSTLRHINIIHYLCIVYTLNNNVMLAHDTHTNTLKMRVQQVVWCVVLIHSVVIVHDGVDCANKPLTNTTKRKTGK